jgi:glucosamine--fructose-6-phosphate aminotransferase (isomerizing)
MDPGLFLADLEEKPDRLRTLAERLEADDPWAFVGELDSPLVLLLGMGSSHYANEVAAARLRHAGVPAVAELASTSLLPRVTPDTVVIAVSASGGSTETVSAVRWLRGLDTGARFVAMTNRAGTELEALCDVTVPLAAGEERGGVACRSFQHTLALLLALEGRVTGLHVPQLLLQVAEASAYLLDNRDDWLPPVSEALLGPQGTHVVAPAHRLSSARQSALMLREGPRLPTYACETADWSHVDVYLTKTTDYRMLLLTGGAWQAELLSWVRERGSTLVAVGDDVDGAAYNLRYRNDQSEDVRLLTETLVAELVAAWAWRVGN